MGSAVSKRREKDKNYLLQTLDEHEAGINCMVLSEDGSVLATGSDDHSIRLWSAKTDLVECIGILTGHQDYVTCIIIEENFLISASADKTLRKWDMSLCQCLFIFTGHTSLISRVICTGDFIFSTSYDRTARCWDIDSGTCVRVFRGHKHGVLPILFVPSEQDEADLLDDEIDIYTKDVIITGSQDNTAKSWSFESGECLKTFKGHTAAILCLTTDRQGKLLFTGAADNFIRCWDIFRGNELRVFEAHSGSIINVVVINKLLFSSSSDHTVRCFVTEFGDCTRVYKGHKHTVSCLQVKNGLVYTGCGDAFVRCFDARSGILKRTFKSHTLAVSAMETTKDRLFSGSVDGTLKVWDIATLKPDTVETTQLPVKKPDTNKLDPNSSMNSSQGRNLNTDKRSDVDSGIDEREFRDRAHDMV
ncbi:unnamed protein product [Didymodactylos carnosus]|uniref:WD repeat-containing protein 86 n=2 Tax=Didymodactylos carnosus TaxID=1234261 RepID=A0A814A9N1_9BILA|nr:unnamed protein product [Didymodactylos carnosus]CAF3692587.1 unnamed protein product [Didymodactylos carnosus]